MVTNMAFGVAKLVADSGGKIVGRTKLQKIGYIIEEAGLGEGFEYDYKHYGPFSQALVDGTHEARYAGLIEEEEKQAAWGGVYSVYTLTSGDMERNEQRAGLAELLNAADPVELELAATALFFRRKDHPSPWQETSRRKPEKASAGRLERAKQLYENIRSVQGIAERLPTL